VTSGPLVSVIVPVFNDPEGLRACLAALSAQTYPRERTEVIVIDNDSARPPKPVVAAFEGVRLESEARLGSYAARNRGIAAAGGDILAFTDADCVPASDWLASGVAALTGEERRHVVGGRIEVVPAGGGRPNAVELYEMLYSFRHQESLEMHGSTFTANLFTWRSVMEDAGPFLDSLLSGADGEWGRRACVRGYSVSYAADVLVVTRPRRSLIALWRRSARLRGGLYQMDRLGRDASLRQHWRPRKPRLEDLRLLLDYREAGMLTKALVVPVAVSVRLVFLLEGLRLALGAKALR
jgi:glycosyltransferase involved in cell wall biosynthesis